MVAEPKVIPVGPDSDLAKLVDPFANYDPERVLEAFEQAAGLFDGMDVEWLKAELRAQRGQDRRGRST